MTTYKVTTELKTPWWKRLFRFFKFIAPRKEFEISFKKDWFRTGDILDTSSCNVKIISRVKNK